MNLSFSYETKAHLCEIPVKQKCCRRALFSGLLYPGAPVSAHIDTDCAPVIMLAHTLADELIPAAKGTFTATNHGFSVTGAPQALTLKDGVLSGTRCAGCEEIFLRGVFLTHGTVTAPDKGYHLSLSFDDEASRDALCAFLSSIGMQPKHTVRGHQYLVYFKESTAIEDFLAHIGANRAAFNLMNHKILREFRNNANRIANCETANIDKTVAASQKYIQAIHKLQKTGRFGLLPPELQITAKLRLEHEELSLGELGRLLTPPLSKPALSHRLNKILNFAQDEKKAEN